MQDTRKQLPISEPGSNTNSAVSLFRTRPNLERNNDQDLVNAIADAVESRISGEHARSKITLTFGDLFHSWLENYAKPHFVPYSVLTYERCFRNHFAAWKDMPVYEIRRSAVAEWHADLAKTNGPGAANRCQDLMRMVFNRAIDWELIPDNHNPATKLRKHLIRSRSRFLQSIELPRFFAALETLRYQTTKDFLLMCLLTAARRSNVAEMSWNTIDMDFATWTIPRTKNGTEQVVPLTPLALVILERRRLHAKTKWVFESDRSSTGHITKPEKAWRELVKRAGLENCRIHDLRRTLASWEAITGANISVIAKTLNHSSLASTAIYARLNVTDQRRAMQTATDAILQAAGRNTETHRENGRNSAKPLAESGSLTAVTVSESKLLPYQSILTTRAAVPLHRLFDGIGDGL